MNGNLSTHLASKYILAIVPNEPVLGDLLLAKNQIKKFIVAEQDLTPHIKIFPKFEWEEKDEYLLIHEIKNLIPLLISFEVDLLQIEKNKELSQIYLQTLCKVELNKYLDLIYIHLTKLIKEQELTTTEIDGRLIMAEDNFIAANFTSVCKRLSQKIYSGVFIADKITLFKNIGNGWQTVAQFHLN